MSRKWGGILAFGLIGCFLLLFGPEFFNAVWSFPGNFQIFTAFPPLLVIVLLGTGIFVTLYLLFPQLRYFWHGIRVTMGIYDNPDDEGDLNHFRALTTALSATVGIGNIAGVAMALYYGGPGALFWMWVTAIFGTTLKYAECTLSLRYREIHQGGLTAGGPMYTIENGLGSNYKWLAVAFAAFAVICSLAMGDATQAFTASDQIRSEFVQILGTDHLLTATFTVWAGYELCIIQMINGLILATIVGLVIIGGIKRIGRVTGYLAPIMACIYTISALLILAAHFPYLGESFVLIFSMAFNPPAGIAGVGGGALLYTMLWGIKRGLFSNEAGQGSAAIAHSTAKTKYPVREGTVALLGPYIDTLLICSLTGLVIISTGAWHHTEFYVNRIDPNFAGELLNSSLLTSFAFKQGLGWLFGYGDKIVTLSVLLFAVSTSISWSFYGDRSADYLFGSKAILPYKWVFLVFIFLGAISEIEAVWAFGDAALGFMTFPNLISIVLLSGTLKKMTKDYFAVKYPTYKERLEERFKV